jgi:hypothetical protein
MLSQVPRRRGVAGGGRSGWEVASSVVVGGGSVVLDINLPPCAQHSR